MINRRKILRNVMIFFLLLGMSVLCLGCGAKKKAAKEIPFAGPRGMLAAEDGYIYIADYDNNNILRMKDGKSRLVAGKTLPLNEIEIAQGGYADGSLEEALFNRPFDIAVWGENGFAVSDMGNHCIRLVTEEGVRTLAGTGVAGCHNDLASLATFHTPAGIVTDEEGNLYIADSGNGVIRCLTPDGMVYTKAEGLGQPMGLCWYQGELYISDAGLHQILKLDKEGHLSVVAGKTHPDDDLERADGNVEEAVFCAPHGLEVVEDVIYVVDTGFSAVRKIEDGQVTTLVQSEGTGKDLWPSRPMDIVYYEEKLYVSDSFNGVIFTVDI